MKEKAAWGGLGRRQSLAVAAAVVAAAAALRLMGRVWWCEAGDWALWSGEIASRHNSQHPLDPYTLTHLLHGILFYAAFRLLFGDRVGTANRFVLTVWAESLWEVLENTPWIIERYREATFAFGYFGDSVINSLGDILLCALGFLWAARVPVRVTAATVVTVEVLLLFWIKDSLALNILMLLWPLEAVREWQTG